ncbi:Uu.00g106510.m01.CDS01 [Anthostomella pinea]|uniref:Uu.00g106510.m01.CDS01 n=1 Tax=Anthostomella pinea TaxID=933095 RepID=A0AAI8VE38_9PEZI|nr:Uu.00g106510.m01.CDS01 [Anthostomella pinea]
MEDLVDAMDVSQDAAVSVENPDLGGDVNMNVGDDIDTAMEAAPVPSSDTAIQDSQDPSDQDSATAQEDGDQYQLVAARESLDIDLPNKPRLHVIEVELSPPADPDSYEQIPLSWTVQQVHDEIDAGDDTYYSVEFDDGRIEQVAYDELQEMKNGRRSMKRYQEQRFSLNSTIMVNTKRPRPEDDYAESGSDYEDFAKPLKRVKRLAHHGSRRSARQASRQASADTDLEDHDIVNSYIDPDSDEDNSIDNERPTPRNRRSSEASSNTGRKTRSQNTTSTRSLRKYAVTAKESDDELAQPSGSDGDDDHIPYISSDVRGVGRTSRRKPKKTQRSSLPMKGNYGSDSDIEFEVTRRSGRSNRNVKSMRDPELEDDYEAVDERVTNAPKHIAVKENFQTLPPDSQFSNVHSEVCETCRNESGHSNATLIHCQGCSYSYHKACIGQRASREHRASKIGDDSFVLQCKFCIGIYKKKDKRAPDHSMCQTCKLRGASCAEFSPKKTTKQEEKARSENDGQDPVAKVDSKLINNAENVLFRCSICRCGYHFEHLPPTTSAVIDPDNIRDDRIEEYRMQEWTCKDCVIVEHKVDGLVAWRPVDQEAYLDGQVSTDFDEDAIEYLVKWDGRSHFHDVWMPGAWVHGATSGTMRVAFLKREAAQFPKMDSKSAIEEEWLLADVFLGIKYRTRSVSTSKAEDMQRIDEIASVFVKFQGLNYEDVVWDEPPPRDSGAPWDAFEAAYDEYLNGKYFTNIPNDKMRERIADYRTLDFEKECELKSQPPRLQRGKLMEYQINGVNFLLFNFHQQQNVILADEMGLGKTVQVIAFISSLTQDQPKCWPFLIVVPNSTCPNWRRELKQWAPELRVVTYHGGKAAQDLSYRHELFPDGSRSGMKAHVVITSYEAAQNVKSLFSAVKWVGLIVDEGQRLKNEDTLLYKSLQEMKIPCRILLTGTPLQNNKRELFTLLQFIDPKNNAEALDAKYAELTQDNLPELHKLIKPYFLRRTKAQVLKFLPPMGQIILPVTMTVLQEKLSKSIMARNTDLIKAIVSKQKIKAGERKSLNNIFMDLRQCLCHPFCFNSGVEDKTVDSEQMHRNLVEAAPKLLLLNIMLPKLKEKGHRVLIFSQFLHSLTIIEDFLTGLGLAHARIDGSLSALEKQKRIDAYNAPNSSLFAMLLSTRAGGVGINLATADTVIIYDPDFNPHQDIQALSRAHRIGQKRKVLCFQLMTKNTVEEKIMQMGRKKMALDHALIETLDAEEDAVEDVESILKHGAAALFSDDAKDKITYDSASVDKLLDRSALENTNTGKDESAENQFSFARVWANDQGALTSNMDDAVDEESPQENTSIWENILKVREEEHKRQVESQQREYGRGARRRGAQGIDYNNTRVGFLIEGLDGDEGLTPEQRPEPESGASDVDEDELYIDNDIEEDDEYESDGYGAGQAKGTKGTKRKSPTTTESSNKRTKTSTCVNNASSDGQPAARHATTGAEPTGQSAEQRTESGAKDATQSNEQPAPADYAPADGAPVANDAAPDADTESGQQPGEQDSSAGIPAAAADPADANPRTSPTVPAELHATES